jgi:hypothetical protein
MLLLSIVPLVRTRPDEALLFIPSTSPTCWLNLVKVIGIFL